MLSVKSKSILACTLMWQRECNCRFKWILPSLPLLAEYPHCFGASLRFIWFPLMSEKYIWKRTTSYFCVHFKAAQL